MKKPRNPSTTDPVTQSPDTQELIRQLAYQLYEQRGREDGHDLDDWLIAESEILRTSELESKKAA